jgi:hypothetical protein
MTPKDIKDRMSHDPKLDAFNSKFGRRLRDEYLRTVMREAEQQTLVDTKSKWKEVEVTVTVGERAINLESDFLIPIDMRWRDPNDDVKAEGYPMEILNKERFL